MEGYVTMTQILISVIMPVYNGENFIREAIESILNQTYSNFEFIIINDGSNDLTSEIVREYMKKDKRIVLLERKNRGLVESLNQGIKLAEGKYIARMDADDIAHKNRFEKQINYLLSHPNVDILGTYVDTIGDNEKCSKFKEIVNKTWPQQELVEKKMSEFCFIVHPTVMIKRKMLIKLDGYREKYRRMEDWDLWIRAVKSGYIIENLSEKLLTYRIHNNSKSNVDSEDFSACIYERINMKLEHYYSNIDSKIIYIWGCGEGGKMLYECLNLKEINVEAFIDSYKIGEFMGKKIYSAENLMENNNDILVLIATTQGFKYAEEFLRRSNVEYMYML